MYPPHPSETDWWIPFFKIFVFLASAMIAFAAVYWLIRGISALIRWMY
jgi:hypothetical protein